MNLFKPTWTKLLSVWQRRGVRHEIDAELQFHLEQRIAENIAAGMTAEAAARDARRRFGNVQAVREECREEGNANFGETFWQDLRYATRILKKSPGFTLVAALTLALGIGATTAIFSVVYGVLLHPYPYGHPEGIWAPGVNSSKNQQVMRPYNRAEREAMAQLPAVAQIMATMPGHVLLTGEYAPDAITAVQLTASAFDFMQVAPLVGRCFGPSDFHNGQPEPVAVISYKLWQRLFAGKPEAIGRTLRLEGQDYTVIGVMPPRFGWWTSDGLWLPAKNLPDEPGRMFPIVRLKPGITAAVAREQFQVLQHQLAKAYPDDFPKESFDSSLTNYLDMTTASGEMQGALHLLFAAVLLLLLIACANVANLQLARATARAREMAIRLSIGAGRGRILRQLLTESVLLSLVGGVLGLVFALGITRLMVLLMPDYYVPNEARIQVNGPVLWFCVAVSVATGVVFGLMPAWQSSRPDLTDALKADQQSMGLRRGGRLRAILVVGEVAAAVVLLVSAGLTIRSFVALVRVDPGFRPERTITMYFTLPPARYKTLEQRNQFLQALLERVQRLPGVQAAEAGNSGLPNVGPDSTVTINGQPVADTKTVALCPTSADYLKTFGVRLLRGRMYEEREVLRQDRYVVINEAAAKLWPAGQEPIGSHIQLGLFAKLPGLVLLPTNATAELTVIGIFANTRNQGLTQQTQPAVLVPYTLVTPPDRTLAVRTFNDPRDIMNSVRSVARDLDAEVPLLGVQTVQEALWDEARQPRFIMTLFSVFAAVGLGLATLGIYSVLSYLVARRTREIGVRMALGAQRTDVLGLIFRDGGRLVGLGLGLGVLASFGVTRFLASHLNLFQTTATDPVAFMGVVLVLGLTAAVACLLPALRAARVQPMTALRHD
ncbi:MAG TPA: ABC transporter permease [Dongiaceae bacterium]|nr:ABC transporter permease [Dongiaceae bacterium]